MLRFLFISFVLWGTMAPAFSQKNTLHLKIKDGEGSLPYASINIKGKIQDITDAEGCLLINKTTIQNGDSLIVKYIGFETKKINLKPDILKRESFNIVLTKKSFELDEVVVTAKTKFDAKKYFLKCRKKRIYPYFQPITAKIDCDKGQNITRNKQTIVYKIKKGEIHAPPIKLPKVPPCTTPLTINTKMIIANTISVADWFCDKKMLSKFSCEYKGKEGEEKVWKFKALDEEKASLLQEVNNEELVCIVKLNKEGVISEIKTFVVEETKAGLTSSLSEVKYKLFRNQIIASEAYLETCQKGKKAVSLQ